MSSSEVMGPEGFGWILDALNSKQTEKTEYLGDSYIGKSYHSESGACN